MAGKMHAITLIPGDGIGPEVTGATVRILEAAGKKTGVSFDWRSHDAGADAYARTGEYIAQGLYDSLEETRVGLKGPVGTPIGGGFSSINVALRKKYELFANFRPIKNLPGLETRYPGIDLIIVRENTEDLYAGLEMMVAPGVAQGLKIITEKGSTRVAKFAFEYAKKHGRKKVHSIHKANIMKITDGLFLECARRLGRISGDRVQGTYRGQHVHAAGAESVPVRCDSDGEPLWGHSERSLLGVCGWAGAGSGANLGTDMAIFEAVHGSAPDIAGEGYGEPDGSASECDSDAFASG